ncbi:MAG: putative e Multidrug resistance protein 2 (Multidrug-efflux transporter 2) [Acidimicrobiales bacterium]|nr:putative e Multidrug resistance protein 2 (Multidrug-efflux transporter 2) [Acidimicrobiales bacterium]
MTFVQSVGASVILPQLPVYLRDRGSSDQLVGVIVAAFFAAGVVFQYPAGRLADRIGRRPVLLGGLVCFAVGSFGFVLPTGPGAYVVWRAVQGLGVGASQVAGLAMLSAHVGVQRRGRAFGSMYSALLAGMAVGPLIGVLAGVGSMRVVFVVGGLASLAACVPVIVGVPRREASLAATTADAGGAPPTAILRSNRVLTGALLTAAAYGVSVGVYESCWTLLLKARGAHDWQVGLSWTLFALPFVLMARPGGWLADHLDRRRLVVGSLSVSLLCCASYPYLGALPLLFAVGAIEAASIAVALPAAQSMLTEAASPAQQGRVQGLFSTSQTAATALAAAMSGALFAAADWAPFVVGAVLTGLFTASLPFVWASAPGRAAAGEPAGAVSPSGYGGRAASGPPARAGRSLATPGASTDTAAGER